MEQVKVCQRCKGDKTVEVVPFKVSPPRGESWGGYYRNSNIPIPIIIVCPMCDGRGHH